MAVLKYTRLMKMIYNEMLDAVGMGAVCYRSSDPTYRVFRDGEILLRSYAENVKLPFVATISEINARDWECVHEHEDPLWKVSVIFCSYIPEILKQPHERVYQ